MTRGCFGALRLAAARPIVLHACSATVRFLHSWAVLAAYFSSLAIYIMVSGHSVSFMRGMMGSYETCPFHWDATHSYMYVIQHTATHCNTTYVRRLIDDDVALVTS